MTATHLKLAGDAEARPPLSALSSLTAAALLAGAGSLIYAQAALLGTFELDLSIFAGLELAAAGVIALPALRRRHCTPLLGSLFGVLTVAANSGPIVYDLAHPEALHTFAFMLIAVSIALVMAVAGLAATIQNYRRPAGERPAPRGLATTLVALSALVAGGIAVAAIPRPAGAGVSQAVLDALPALSSPGFSFDQTELRVRAGELVALRLENPHGVPHSFDIDELDVHVSMPTGQDALALFRPTAPGTYTFYCAVPGHLEAGMRGTLIVEP